LIEENFKKTATTQQEQEPSTYPYPQLHPCPLRRYRLGLYRAVGAAAAGVAAVGVAVRELGEELSETGGFFLLKGALLATQVQKAQSWAPPRAKAVAPLPRPPLLPS